ncbi:MAG: hypothetical protein DRG09_02100 [Epsilonproteobacteria bacterium]|nr:MAG: hypothetical protein DRG09_02100 [Campylobacterota bacterium]
MYKKINTLMRVLAAASIGVAGLSTAALSEEDHHGHEGHEWELGISAGYANLKTEEEEGVNLHLHLLKSLGDEGFMKYFSAGFGAEMIRTDETHYGAMVTLAYHPVEDLTLSVSPGYEWEKHEDSWESHFAMHYEASYSFDISESYHIGPVIGYSKTSEAEHYTVGIHIFLFSKAYYTNLF